MSPTIIVGTYRINLGGYLDLEHPSQSRLSQRRTNTSRILEDWGVVYTRKTPDSGSDQRDVYEVASTYPRPLETELTTT